MIIDEDRKRKEEEIETDSNIMTFVLDECY